MKHLMCLLLCIFFSLPVMAQIKINFRLKHELDSLFKVDQQYRAMLFDSKINRNPDSLAAVLGISTSALNKTIMDRMHHTDSANLLRIQDILKQFGYPGKSIVGAPTNEAVWHILQHNPATIAEYLPLVKAAAENGELPFTRYATMLDRQLMALGKEQLYGTQARAYSGQAPFVWPILNPTEVNQRRKQAGFDTTVEEYAIQLGIIYRTVTLLDVARMPK